MVKAMGNAGGIAIVNTSSPLKIISNVSVPNWTNL